MVDYSTSVRYLVGRDEADAKECPPISGLDRAYRIAETVRAQHGTAEIYEVQMIVDFETMKLTDRSVNELPEVEDVPVNAPVSAPEVARYYWYRSVDVKPFGDATAAVVDALYNVVIAYVPEALADEFVLSLTARPFPLDI